MAGLFSMPSPEAVRANARQRLQQNAINQAQLAPGRGAVALASKAGGLFGEAIGRGLGGVNPEEERAKKFQSIQQDVSRFVQEKGIDLSTPAGQIKMISESVKRMGDFPEQQFAALQMLNQLRSQVPVESETFSELQPIPGTEYLGQKGSVSGKYINVKDKAGNKVGGEGAAVVPSALDREIIKVDELTLDKDITVGKKTFSPEEITNKNTYNTWIADRAKELQTEAKQQKKTIGFQKAVAKAKSEADKMLSEVGQKWTFGGMKDLKFSPPEEVVAWDDL